jgi:hypothetical protein
MTKELEVYLNESALPHMRPMAECSINVTLSYDIMEPVYYILLIFDLSELGNNPYNLGKRWEIEMLQGLDFDYHLLQQKTYNGEELEYTADLYVLNYWEYLKIHQIAFGEMRQDYIPFTMVYSIREAELQKMQTLHAHLRVGLVSIYFTSDIDLEKMVPACQQKLQEKITFNSWYQMYAIIDEARRTISFQLK